MKGGNLRLQKTNLFMSPQSCCVYTCTLAYYCNSNFQGNAFYITTERAVRSLVMVALKSCDLSVVCL